MDVLSVRVYRPGGTTLDAVRLLINGRDFRALVREAELAAASTDGQRELAGSYAGLTPRQALSPSRHLLGEPNPADRAVAQAASGRVPLLVCLACRDADCWSLGGRIECTDEGVVWRDFDNHHRPEWRYPRLGPFTFERSAYEAALGFPPAFAPPGGHAAR
jgi:hypothetical protein